MRRGNIALIALLVGCGGTHSETQDPPVVEGGPAIESPAIGDVPVDTSATDPPDTTPDVDPEPPRQTPPAVPPKVNAEARDNALVEALPPIDFVTPLSVAGGGDTEEATKRNAAGLALYAQKNYTDAAAEYSAALLADPGHLLARYNLACALALAGQVDRGLALLFEMVRADERCAECANVVTAARGDDDWADQWGTPVFQAIMRTTYASNGDFWNAGCPKGTRLKKKPAPDSAPEYFEGRAWCEKGGKKHGPYYYLETLCHDGEGTCSESGTYANGRKHGFWVEAPNYYGSEAGYYVNGKRHGLWSEDLKEGYADTVYRNGMLHGPKRVVHEEPADVVLVETYEDDKLHGPYKQWNEYGDYVVVAEGVHDKGTKHGVWTLYRSSGGTKYAQESYDHGVRHGAFVYWDAAGKELGRTEMSHGDGDWLAYGEDGTLLERGAFVKGKKDGVWTETTTYPRYTSTGTYEKGVRVGAWKSVDPESGNTLTEGSYVKGKREGMWTYRYTDGSVFAEGAFAGGKPDGTWKVEGETMGGHVEQVCEFKRGALVKVDGEKPDRDLLQGWKLVREDWGDNPRPIEPPYDPMPY